MTLSQSIGDTVTHRIPLRWRGRPFEPGAAFFLIFTVKADKDTDTDAQAKIQKTSDLGLTVSGSKALVDILPIDTAGDPDADPVVPALDPGTYDFGIKAQSIADPTDVRTVHEGEFVLLQPTGRGTETAVPTYVAGPGLVYDTQIVTYF